MKRIVYILVVLIVVLLASCTKTIYVPTETVRTEYKDNYITLTDSLFIRDSVYIDRSADTILIERWHTKVKESVKHDSIFIEKTDSIQIPYPVQTPLTKWQRFCIDYGKVFIGITIFAIILFVVYLARKMKNKLG